MRKFIRNYANIPNPITKFFNKIEDVELDGDDQSINIEWLEAMKKVPLYVKTILLYPNNTNELEILTDPNLHNPPIDNLHLSFKNVKISSKTIENLKAICPNSITINEISPFLDESTKQASFDNFTKLLSELDQTSLEMDFEENNFNLKLEFIDVIFKVMESKKECSYIRAKSVEIQCLDEELCWIK